MEVRFDCVYRDDLGVPEVVPSIDGVPLTVLIDRYEMAARMRPSGDAYGGLPSPAFEFGPTENHFHGRSPGSKTPLLGCECGEWGCWPLLARITVTADLVSWDAFEQPFRPDRDYTTFGPFQFERHQYDAALGALSRVINA